MQCTSNLKQIALALHNYADVVGTLPMGGQAQRDAENPSTYFPFSAGLFVAILAQAEQQATFNAVNFNVNICNAQNFTVAATGIALYWCPRDGTVQQSEINRDDTILDLGGQRVTYTSFAGNNFLFPYDSRPRRFTEITDGTSRTFLLGEKVHSDLSEGQRFGWHWWFSGHSGDTRFDSLFPLNAYRKIDDHYWRDWPLIFGASSHHPGGAELRDGRRLGPLRQGHHRVLEVRPE